jgi:hypothetical protein
MSKASALYPNLSPEDEPTTKPERSWSELSRNERLASILYPRNVSEARRKEMISLAKGEGKRGPGEKKGVR